MACARNMGGTCPGVGEGGEALLVAVANREGDAFHAGYGRRDRAMYV